MARQLRASRLLEELKMFAGFDAVGDHVKIEATRHGDDRGRDSCNWHADTLIATCGVTTPPRSQSPNQRYR
ncbi:hypothetical protein ACCUM_1574 [Candidatus Accumulibacter phosphatis]|uniref:Uncharacterized protein n=1 Tax=Candidatus Accumulibacter phosphatis TaxID=327160 RepID=A0A5S4EIY4_9PROT|nr:hypothetical protein ACCUM_1574 [Candidatus Accumulibacter phosphatis]